MNASALPPQRTLGRSAASRPPRNPANAAEGRPILVFVERNVRIFDYLLLPPGVPGYNQMLHLTATLPQVGKGTARVLTDTDELRANWPSWPLLKLPVA